MSRTDVHRPKWVQDRDRLTRPMIEVHRHETGPCDLDAWRAQKGHHHRSRCYLLYVGGRNPYCGCRLCTGHDGRLAANGKARARWRTDRAMLGADRDHEPRAMRLTAW